MPDIFFDAQGGFTTPNGLHVPAEQMEKIVFATAKLARIVDDWGYELFKNADEDTKARKVLESAHWTLADRGNLIRIARAADKFVHLADLLENVLIIARFALSAPAIEAQKRQNDYLKKAKEKADELIAQREKRHGPCPPDVRDELRREMLWLVKNRANMGLDAHRFNYDGMEGYLVYDYCDDLPRMKWCGPVGKRRSKLRKHYDRWMAKRVKRKPDSAPG